ncbi:glycosyltransferase 61 family protein [Nodosilinea sp. PGN35]|uniref:glycosyltransferase 61 family protein n=1 Tax=Nodosilinea sp. PGN35 TaxID=3020489 RepID=UPI0023B24D79|nr:glycosyltransferase family 61 protein [Nodosilinea sp. TSF1-S3]MDF0369464.1 glycosyltransferase family 61 protein [Nodosilinea sp. TSF1-S3]
MDITLKHKVPGLEVAPSMMYCFPTGAMDVWRPAAEQVLMPAQYLEPFEVEIKVKSATAKLELVKTLSWKRKTQLILTKAIKRKARLFLPKAIRQKAKLLVAKIKRRKAQLLLPEARTEGEALDFSGKFIFDARFDVFTNIGHILENVATPVFLAQKLLSEHFQKDIKIHIILSSRVPNYSMPMDVYRLLGNPVIFTDDDVYGELVTCSEHRVFSIRPHLFNFEFPGYKKETCERIFVSRRGSRSLINNDEVTQFLEERGFKTLYFEDLSLEDEWSIARNAKEVVVVHGAASSNFILNRVGLQAGAEPGSGLKLIELMSPAWNFYENRYMTNALNGRWCCVRGQITPQMLNTLDFDKTTPDSQKSPFKDPFRVDCQTIQMALDYLSIG